MKAVKTVNPGAKASLEILETAKPTPRTGEILIKVRAAGVNRPDLLQRAGRYAPPAGVTDILGLEVAGEIEALGKKTPKGFKVGDKVCALVSGGGYAQYVAVPAVQCLPVPKGFSMTEAAALPETFFTVWVNVFEIAGLKKGETLLVHGGSSGIGTVAILLGKAFGAKVIVTAGSDKKCRACKKLGADKAINYKTQDFTAEIKTGVDVVLDMVGGSYVARNISLLKDKGRHVSIAVQGGAEATVPLYQLMQKRLVLTGSTLRPRMVAEKGAIRDALLRQVWGLLAKGKIRPVIDSVFDLDDVEKAHARMISGEHIGKIVLNIKHNI